MIPTPVLPCSHNWRTADNDWRAPLIIPNGFETLLALGPGLVLITSLDPASPLRGQNRETVKGCIPLVLDLEVV